jgi:signal transduction histidine kinase
MKIRSKLTVQFISITAAIFIVALYFIYKQFEFHIENEQYTLLESKALMTAEMVLRDEEKLKPIISTYYHDQNSELPITGNTAIYNQDFECVFKVNLSAPITKPSILSEVKKSGILKFVDGSLQAVGLSTNSNKNNEFIVVASDVPDYSKLKKLRNILFLSFFIVMVAVAAGGWFFAKQSLNPVEKIVTEVEKIIPSNLSNRLPMSNQKDELSHLVRTFNKLLERIDEAFQLQKSFISNVSHEIKNPIAAIDAQIQLAKSKFKDQPETSALLNSIHEDITEINETNDKLLQLSKFYSDKKSVVLTTVRIDEIIFDSINYVAKNEKNKVNFDFIMMPEDESLMSIKGNESLLKTAFINLIENACKFSPKQYAKIELDFSEKNWININIINEAINANTIELNKLFEPFFRSLQHNDIKGSGLGLSIVKNIMDIHKFEISVKKIDENKICFLTRIDLIKNANEKFNLDEA